MASDSSVSTVQSSESLCTTRTSTPDSISTVDSMAFHDSKIANGDQLFAKLTTDAAEASKFTADSTGGAAAVSDADSKHSTAPGSATSDDAEAVAADADRIDKPTVDPDPDSDDDTGTEISRPPSRSRKTYSPTRNKYDGELSELDSDIKYELCYRSLAEPLDKRRQLSSLRNHQSVSYLLLVEDRIKDLEQRLADVEKAAARPKSGEEKSEKAESVADGDTEVEEPYKLDIAWLGYTAFTMLREYPFKPPRIIDVMVEPMGVLPVNNPRARYQTPTHSTIPDDEKAVPTVSERKIERIRINSDLITEALGHVMSKDLAPGYGRTHIRPFKALLSCVDGIKDYLQELQVAVSGLAERRPPSRRTSKDATTTLAAEQDVGSGRRDATSTETPEESSPDKSVGSNDAEAEKSHDEEMIEHLNFFLDFVDEHLKGDLELQNKLQTASLPADKCRISFADLWKLFEPGNLVYEPRESQALQVLSVSGGRPALRWKPKTSPSYEDDYQEKPAPTNNAFTHIEAEDVVSPFTVVCFSLDFDGTEVGPVQRSIRISPFEGQRDINALPVFPIKYADIQTSSFGSGSTKSEAHKNNRSVVERLTERGRLYAKLTNPKEVAHRDYNGLSLGSVREHIDSDVIIDFDLYFQLKPDARPTLGLREPTEGDLRETQQTGYIKCQCDEKDCDINNEADLLLYDDRQVDRFKTAQFIAKAGAPFVRHGQYQKVLKNEHCILFPRLINGFVLKERNWQPLDLDLLRPVRNREQAFEDELILPKQHKDMVESLVKNHSLGPKPVEGTSVVNEDNHSSQDLREDLVRGKGKGLIILLHGVPGVGKTSTAECVAEYTKRPLFALTCGDIGDDPVTVQKNLTENFTLAHRWGCVMLLDEADVFLQARDKTDMKRNAVVSVFLRTLEYYSGILFLTTNKVGMFDEAFKSRIHVSLYYRALDPKTSMEIWRVNLVRIRRTKPHITFNQDKLLAWVKKQVDRVEKKDGRPWNGRQIHNACQTAAALAAFLGNNKLTTEHLKAVHEASKEFDLYLKSTHGADDMGVAEREKYRGDDVFGHVTGMTPKQEKKKSRKAKRDETSSEDDSDDDDATDDEDADKAAEDDTADESEDQKTTKKSKKGRSKS